LNFSNYSVLKLFIPQQSGFRFSHSVRNDLTGFASAAFIARKLTVMSAINIWRDRRLSCFFAVNTQKQFAVVILYNCAMGTEDVEGAIMKWIEKYQ
jgi:hypothetical protein